MLAFAFRFLFYSPLYTISRFVINCKNRIAFIALILHRLTQLYVILLYVW